MHFPVRLKNIRFADRWLDKISNIVGCERESILTVPGNHDVDRTEIGELLLSVHKSFRDLKKRRDIDSKLSKILNSSDADFLVKPFNNYNKFANKYGSIPSQGNVLFWEKNFSVNEFIVRIRGVNSALISNENDDEHSSKLFLSSHQTLIKREPNVINILMCHHPPQWLYDHDEVKVDVSARTAMQLYGHKHKEGSQRIDNSLVLSAGAMRPSRKDERVAPLLQHN